ncbi:MAG: phage portal protein [Acidobacteriota bacterium]|nr:MAG: phage portal protein [Acidobacteriota bacterium]
MKNNDIEKAITRIRSGAARYAKAERYYEGRHDLAFATEKFQNTFGSLFREFALNLCPIVCDAVRDKLRITGFSSEVENAGTAVRSVNAIWRRNRMETRAGEAHKEALRCGDAYVVVWPNARGEAVIHPNRAANMAVFYDDETPGVVTLAAKRWRVETGGERLNLYYADRIEKYSCGENGGEKFTRDAVVKNPFGVVPVFHFANNADIGSSGRSELDAAIPVQDGLNKSVLDMLVAMEFAAYRQRWAAGIELDLDQDGKPVAPFRAGVEHLWISENPDAKFGDFEAARLDQFLKVKDSFRVDMATVTGTPLHYFVQNASGFPSGESLRRAESRFLAKVRDRQAAFGEVWADVMSFALRIKTGRHAHLRTLWEDAAPPSEKERLGNLLLKRQLGIPQTRLLAEAGYGAAESDRKNEEEI